MNVRLVTSPVPPSDLLVNRSNYCCDTSKAAYRKQPLDLIIASGVLDPAHQVSYVDGAAPGFDAEVFSRDLRRDGVRCVVLLIGSLTRDADAAFIERLRQGAPELTIVATGDICRFEPTETLRDMAGLDAVLLDFSTPNLLRFLEGEANLTNVVARRDTRPVPLPQREPVFDIAPPRHELFDSPYYRPALSIHGRVAETLFSFGCPHGCRFCLMESIGHTPRDLGSARRELARINELGYPEIHFCDATFGARREWTIELLEIMRRESRQTWWASTRVDVLDADLVRRMRSAGCHTLTMGVETATDAVNHAFDKHISTERTNEAFALCREAGIRTLAHVILGLPGETLASLDRTLAFLDELDPFYVSLNVMETWRHTSFGDGYRREHGEHLKQVPGTTHFYPERASLPLDVVLARRAEGIRRFYLSPRRWLRYLGSIRTGYELAKYVRNGWEVVRRYRGEAPRKPGRDADR